MINIKTNSNKIKPGDIFVALKGLTTDGHGYIDKAINNGAIKVIAEHGNYDVETIIVPDTRQYLTNYLKEKYKKYLDEMILIGITGTNGKTTTSYLIYQALNKLGIKCGYIGTIGFYQDKKISNLSNTSPEISEIYDMLIDCYEKNIKCVVMEVSSQGLAHKRFEGISFNYTIFTNLTQDHLDYHITLKNYCLTKQQLFFKLKKSGIAIVNSDDYYKDYFILPHNKTVTYGFNNSDYKIEKYLLSNNETIFRYSYNNHINDIISPLIGKYNIYNILPLIVLLKQFNINDRLISKCIKTLSSPPGRMEKINYNSNNIIIDYAHTPDAIKNILETIKETTNGHIYVVFGCTGNRDKLKRPIMTDIVTNLADKAIITIDDLHNEEPDIIVNDMVSNLTNTNYLINLDRSKAIIMGINLLNQNDTLLILGKGHEEYLIVKDKKIPFSDKKVVLDYLKTKEVKLKIS